MYIHTNASDTKKIIQNDSVLEIKKHNQTWTSRKIFYNTIWVGKQDLHLT